SSSSPRTTCIGRSTRCVPRVTRPVRSARFTKEPGAYAWLGVNFSSEGVERQGMARILVVDDEPDILLLQRLNLEGAGHDVLLAADGMKALERIDADDPDCVVLDVMMPVLDGWGVLEALQTRETAPPVLVVSAKSAAADIDHALSMGAKGYLAKPFNA